MKTRKEYLLDFEFSPQEIPNLTKKDIKKRYGKLVLKYNVDNKNNNTNEAKYRTILEAYDALNNDKYLDEPIIEESLNVENTAELYNKALIDFLESAAFEINLKKNDNKVVIVDNHIINFNVLKLTKRKFLIFNKNKLLKLVRK